jgi:hypothetical protein
LTAVENGGAGIVSPRRHQRIVIEANRFDRCGGDPVRAEKANEVRIE